MVVVQRTVSKPRDTVPTNLKRGMALNAIVSFDVVFFPGVSYRAGRGV